MVTPIPKSRVPIYTQTWDDEGSPYLRDTGKGISSTPNVRGTAKRSYIDKRYTRWVTERKGYLREKYYNISIHVSYSENYHRIGCETLQEAPQNLPKRGHSPPPHRNFWIHPCYNCILKNNSNNNASITELVNRSPALIFLHDLDQSESGPLDFFYQSCKLTFDTDHSQMIWQLLFVFHR